MGDMDSDDGFFDPELEALERLSNSVLHLIKQGRLEDAERACLELERRYPDQIDGLDRMASVHEARGNLAGAIECHRRCLHFILSHPDGFDEDSKDFYRGAIARLESGRN